MLLKTYQWCNFINKIAICLFCRICWIDASKLTCGNDMEKASSRFDYLLEGYERRDIDF